MRLPLKCYTYLLCIIFITLYSEALAKGMTDGELDKAEPNRINNGTLIRLAKHLSDKVKKGEIFTDLFSPFCIHFLYFYGFP